MFASIDVRLIVTKWEEAPIKGDYFKCVSRIIQSTACARIIFIREAHINTHTHTHEYQKIYIYMYTHIRVYT